MRDWLKSEPIVIASAKGAVLRDVYGKKYIDANSSIWTNLHGHRHPAIDAAIRKQLKKIAHSSALGLANEPASLLAAELVKAANPDWLNRPSQAPARRPAATRSSNLPDPIIANSAPAKVFYSDDGSTALEVALKLAFEFARRTRQISRPRFLSLAGAYHGDTIGAVSLGHIDVFHHTYRQLLFGSDSVPAPYCYRCPFNRAKPERMDAREYRKCKWECVSAVEKKFSARRGSPYAGFVIEPLIQGAAGMIPQPRGWLSRVAEIARAHKTLLIADEVLTGFGRTGIPENSTHAPLFACHHEQVQPDLLALAKGMTGGYLPMAATLATQAIFDAFLGDYSELKTFFHGHSYTANQLGSAAALASLSLLQSNESFRSRVELQRSLGAQLETLWQLQHVGDIRQVGLIAGIELVQDWKFRTRFNLRDQVGIRVCAAMARRGVLTRPIGNVIVIMPPFCTTTSQIERTITALRGSIVEVLGGWNP
jgi:adenosylmethionine---8-amino-7-oxononanoate aminotransferase